MKGANMSNATAQMVTHPHRAPRRTPMTPLQKITRQNAKSELRRQILRKMQQLDGTFPMGGRWEMLREFVEGKRRA